MLVDEAELLAALHLPAGTETEVEPTSGVPGAAERVELRGPEGERRAVVVRRDPDEERAQNHLAVMEALANAGYAHAPRIAGFAGSATIEEWVEGATALAIEPPPGSAEAAMEALAGLHELGIREGLDWECAPEALVIGEDVPLHRLGFAAHEREPALEPLMEGRRAVLETPFGFAHREATAQHVLLATRRAWLVDYGRAGFGPQLFDVAAFLLSGGFDAADARRLAERYAKVRGLPAETTDATDLAGILWGIEELLRLPQRQIQVMGDDAATEALALMAKRIERGMRRGWGSHPAAERIRSALWPS